MFRVEALIDEHHHHPLIHEGQELGFHIRAALDFSEIRENMAQAKSAGELRKALFSVEALLREHPDHPLAHEALVLKVQIQAALDLSDIRTNMLQAKSAGELRDVLFRVEAFLRQHPDHPLIHDVLKLKQQIETAIESTEQPWRAYAITRIRRLPPIVKGFAAVAVLILLVLVLYGLFGRPLRTPEFPEPAARTVITPYYSREAWNATTVDVEVIDFGGIAKDGENQFEPSPPGLTLKGVTFSLVHQGEGVECQLFVTGKGFYYAHTSVLSLQGDFPPEDALRITFP